MTETLKKRLTGKVFTPQRTVSGWELNRLQDRKAYCTTKNINLNDYRITGYLVGNAVHFHRDLNWQCFDTVTYLCDSENPVNGRRAHHFHCYRGKGKDGKERQTIVIAEKIK